MLMVGGWRWFIEGGSDFAVGFFFPQRTGQIASLSARREDPSVVTGPRHPEACFRSDFFGSPQPIERLFFAPLYQHRLKSSS